MDRGINSAKRLPKFVRLGLAIIGSATVPAICVTTGLDIWSISSFALFMEIFSLSIIIIGILPIHFLLHRWGKKKLSHYIIAGLYMSPLIGLLGAIIMLPLSSLVLK
jgi:hypothetical protein